MKIIKFKKRKDFCGYFNTKDGNIYIREDIKDVDYILTLGHELVHWVIYKLFNNNDIGNFLDCWFDMIDSLISTWDFKIVRGYYNYYKV